MNTITNRSDYDACVTAIDTAVKEFMYDQEGQIDVSEDEVWVDMAAALLADASENVAREVCRCQLGFVPQDLERMWRQRAHANAKVKMERMKVKAAEKKQAALEAEQAAEPARVQSLRDRTCPKCFVLRAPSGACNC
jgi:acetone carboxylase gamma subunit